jgi:hypothetical protein
MKNSVSMVDDHAKVKIARLERSCEVSVIRAG